MSDIKHPQQPVVYEEHRGTTRYKGNAIVKQLLDRCQTGLGFGLEDIRKLDFPQGDYEQFLQLLGLTTTQYRYTNLGISEEAERIAQADESECLRRYRDQQQNDQIGEQTPIIPEDDGPRVQEPKEIIKEPIATPKSKEQAPYGGASFRRRKGGG